MEWLNEKQAQVSTGKTVEDCVKEYIDSKENLLSPSSVRGYLIILNNAIDHIKYIPIESLTEKDLQFWVNKNATKYKPKSIKSQFGLVVAELRQNKVKLSF